MGVGMVEERRRGEGRVGEGWGMGVEVETGGVNGDGGGDGGCVGG